MSPDSPNDAGAQDADSELPILTEPADGLGEVVEDGAGLRRAIDALAAGSGPVAVDAERAHGFRYSQRAYLIQLRRSGAGTILIDPIALGPSADLSELAAAISDTEWIIHAANQDLPCLAELSMLPRQLFDTELAGRLLGYPRVNLGTLIEETLQVRLLKEHSAADWSTRPLPREWLIYAALDVELLIGLRQVLADQLRSSGKDEWARQEFAWLVSQAGQPPEVRVDPWRRTSGMHKVRTRRGLAIVAELWQTRDDIARRTDKAPGKILPDAAITDLAGLKQPTGNDIRELQIFRRRTGRRYQTSWLSALDRALALPEDELPPLHRQTTGPPAQARAWAGKDPVAAARLQRVREALAEKAVELGLPVENLLTPEHLRRIAWKPPTVIDEETVDAALAEYGARPWQREFVTPLIATHLPEP